MEIKGSIKNYEWGKLGNESLVAQLAVLNTTAFELSSSTHYAELWMGDHPSGPSLLKSNGRILSTILSEPLPFLFKVLSVSKALSIQVHPNKTEAERLHREQSEIYKDPNHKPELAIALSPFKALCGFRPYDEIHKFIQVLPPLRELINDDNHVTELKNNSINALRKIYAKLMTANANDVGQCIDRIASEYKQVLAANDLLDVYSTLNSDFPNDVGVLSLFFLNLICLNPGEAIFLGANEIHAYIYGNCIECMACSDNVIRAGLTPKYKDVPQLLSCLNYAGQTPKEKLFQPKTIDAFTKLFSPPVPDFAVVMLSIPTSAGTYEFKLHKNGSILLVLHGERSIIFEGNPQVLLKRGSIIYIPPNIIPKISTITESDNDEDFIAYVAMSNHFDP